MRVCLDARKLWDSGIGSYIRGLLQGFQEISPEIGWDFIIRPKDELPPALRVSQSKFYPSTARNYSIKELFDVSRKARLTGADLFHAPHYILPFGLKQPAVATIHDLIHLKFPQYFSPLQRAYARWMFGRAAQGAEKIIAVSENTRRDFIEMLGVAASKIQTIYHGISPLFFENPPIEARQQFQSRHHLPKDYLLYVGNLKPHKNVDGLIQAWAGLKNSLRPPLLIVGAKIDSYAGLASQASRLRMSGQIFFVGEIGVEDLRCAYRLAAALVQPSWYEGFGFPPLEAMASGIPVAASNRGSLPEITGDAALIFDPADGDQFAGALERILTDRALRKDLIDKGRRRAASFTWARCAEKTYQVYQEALADTPRAKG
ncbi:MAG TPA: glycosyltransferase family 1 protein [bacterium]|jgi:glycosyltransferase involved in cell wall biosynthesis